MNKSILLFLLAFLAGAAIALVIRTARYEPKAAPEPAATVLPAVEEHSTHQHAEQQHAATSPAPGGPTVNSVCAICGMDVDPSLPTAVYEGKTIGFGCRACPPKFAADPAKYGPYALKNEVIP
jgi:YHS domain-containing protein